MIINFVFQIVQKLRICHHSLKQRKKEFIINSVLNFYMQVVEDKR